MFGELVPATSAFRSTPEQIALGTEAFHAAGESPRDGWLADAYEAFKNDSAATIYAYLRRVRFYRQLALEGRISG